jgi:hypothetical protein
MNSLNTWLLTAAGVVALGVIESGGQNQLGGASVPACAQVVRWHGPLGSLGAFGCASRDACATSQPFDHHFQSHPVALALVVHAATKGRVDNAGGLTDLQK